jgi:hypothetical protein
MDFTVFNDYKQLILIHQFKIINQGIIIYLS